MPSIAENFLTDIIEHPDDDTPRLIYADWLEEHGTTDAERERGEFIRLQCQTYRRGARRVFTQREHDLLVAYGTEWLEQDTGRSNIIAYDPRADPPLLPSDTSWYVPFERGWDSVNIDERNFERGFLGWYSGEPGQVESLMDATRKRSPISHVGYNTGPHHSDMIGYALQRCAEHPSLQQLTLWSDEDTWRFFRTDVTRVLDSPLAHKLRSLHLHQHYRLYLPGDAYAFEQDADSFIPLLSRTQELHNLKRLSLGVGRIRTDMLRLLLTGPLLQQIESLSFHEQCLSPDVLRELTRGEPLFTLSELDIAELEASAEDIIGIIRSERLCLHRLIVSPAMAEHAAVAEQACLWAIDLIVREDREPTEAGEID